jgi:hypothetical protein
VVEALEVRVGDESQEVPVPGLVAGEDRQVPVLLLVLPGVAVEPTPRSDVGLHPEDGLDAPGPRLPVEVERAEHDPVVGEPDRRHPELLGPVEQADRIGARGDGDAGEPVEQRELGVRMEMDEALTHVRTSGEGSPHRPLRLVWKTCGLMTPL